MVEIQIKQKFGRIGLNIQPLDYDLKIQPAQLALKQKPAQMTLEQPAAIVEIDHTQYREVLGYRSIESQLKLFTSQAYRDYYSGLAETVAEGHKLGHIENNYTIGQIAKEASAFEEKRLSIAYLPFAQVSVTQQPINLDIQIGGVESNYYDGKVDVEVTQPWDVSPYWIQRPYIDIQSTGWAIDVEG